jgi:hypothetical protein
MKEKLNPALIQFSDEFVPEEHSCMPMYHVEASGQDEHRSELDWYIQVEPIERPDFFG